MGLENLKTFDECIKIANQDGALKHLMLGNGFSIALRPDVFNYQQLSEKIEDCKVKQLFGILKTNDFEFVMRRLSEANEIAKHYEQGNTKISHEIIFHLEYIKRKIIDVITNSHPSPSQEIDFSKYLSCQLFLSNFNDGNKYTLNYDLILYWVYMKYRQILKLQHNDGFNERYLMKEPIGISERRIIWDIARLKDQNLFYLHGALHLFPEGMDVKKLTWNSTATIAEQVKSLIETNQYPLFICEGTSEHKISRIKKNRYLDLCLNSLTGIEGNLFIFGHSLRDEDDHIFDNIHQNEKLKKVFISFYGNIDVGRNIDLRKKAEKWAEKFKKHKEYFLYHAESAQVWDSITPSNAI